MSDTVDPATSTRLKHLEVDPGSLAPGLWGDRERFAVLVPHGAATLRLKATPEDGCARVTIDDEGLQPGVWSQPRQLAVGRNISILTVTAPVALPDGVGMPFWHQKHRLRATASIIWCTTCAWLVGCVETAPISKGKIGARIAALSASKLHAVGRAIRFALDL